MTQRGKADGFVPKNHLTRIIPGTGFTARPHRESPAHQARGMGGEGRPPSHPPPPRGGHGGQPLPRSAPQGPALRPRGPLAASAAAPWWWRRGTARPARQHPPPRALLYFGRRGRKKKAVKKQRSVGSLIQGDRRTGVSRGERPRSGQRPALQQGKAPAGAARRGAPRPSLP